MKNILTFDIEDWYHPTLVNPNISKRHNYEDRVVESTIKILKMLAKTQNKATFFVLGYVAEKFPELIKRIKEDGHEIACHGYEHELVNLQGKDKFANDIKKSTYIIENVIKSKILGYRAPSWSLSEETGWVWDILYSNGYKYDSSIYPFKTFLYGNSKAPRFRYTINWEGKRIIEIPPSTVEVFNKRIPFSGGFYFRTLPYWFVKWCIKRINNREKQPVLIYLHPWELDDHSPKISLGLKESFIQYMGLKKTIKKFKKLLEDFQFISIKQFLGL